MNGGRIDEHHCTLYGDGRNCVAKSATKRCHVCYAWFVCRLQKNKIQHCLNGNGGGGSRVTKRRREQKTGKSLEPTGISQIADLLMLLQQILQLCQSCGFDLNALLQKVSGVSDRVANADKKKKKKKKAQKSSNESLPPATTSTPAGRNDGNPDTEGPQKKKADKGNEKGKGKGKSKGKDADSNSRSFADVVKTPPADFQPVWQLRSSDWDADLMSVEDVAEKIESEDVRAVVLVDLEQVDELQNLVQSELSKENFGLTIVRLATKDECSAPGHSLTQVPGFKKGKLVPRLAHVTHLGNKPPHLRKKVQQISTKPTQIDTTVLRISTEARYHPDTKWKPIAEQPGQAVKRWIQKNVPEHAQRQVRDIWGIQLETSKGGGKALVNAFLRVEKTIAVTLLACSGKEAWFIESMKWDSDIPPIEVQWIKRLPDEEGPDYASRAWKSAGIYGLARGIKSLGVRMPIDSKAPRKDKIRNWKISGVPREWGHQELLPELEKAGLSNAQLTSRKTCGKTINLFFTAKAPPEVDFVEFRFENVTMTATSFFPLKDVRTNKKEFKNSGTLNFPPAQNDEPYSNKVPVPKSFYGNSPAKKKLRTEDGSAGVPPTVLDDQLSQVDTQEKTDEPPDGNSSQDRKSHPISPPDDLVIVPNVGKGNCLFLALGFGLNPSKPKAHRGVRAAIVEHLRKHEARYKPWWDGLSPNEQSKPSWSDYLKSLSEIGAWAGSLEIAAAAAHYDRPIFVMGPLIPNQGVEIYNGSSQNDPIALWATKGHYEYLKGKISESKKKQGTAGNLQGRRAGSSKRSKSLPSSGLSDISSHVTRDSAMPPLANPPGSRLSASGSGRTRISALPQFESIDSKSVCPTAASDLQDASALDDFDSSIGDADKSTNSGKRRISTSWTCPICSWTTTAPLLYQKKAKHLASWHPADRAACKIVQAIKLEHVTQDNTWWKCPKCNLGITQDQARSNPRTVLAWCRQKHHREAHPKAKASLFRFKATDGQKNARKRAHAGTRNKAAAKRILLKKESPHDFTFFKWPNWHQTRAGRQDLICTVCRRIARSVTQLNKSPCNEDVIRSRKRQNMLTRLRNQLQKAQGEKAEDIRNLLSIFDTPVPKVKAGNHQIGTLKKPAWLKFCRVTSEYCVKCKRIAANYTNFAAVSCDSKIMRGPNRKAFLNKVRALAGKSAKKKAEAEVFISQLTSQSNDNNDED